MRLGTHYVYPKRASRVSAMMKNYIQLCFISYVFFLVALTHSSYAVEDYDAAIKLLFEENRYLRNEIKDLKATCAETRAPTGKHFAARTCHDLTRSDPTLESGMYYIDPDGWNTGDPPIYVYCDKESGITHVLHDSQEKMSVGHCPDPGCYSRPASYNASMRQMRALIELSPLCDQYIRYDCLSAVFEFNEVQYCWWNDRNGDPQYYWAGNNGTKHTCSCGIDGTCIEPTVRCQCDTSTPTLLTDDGYINNKDHLPITRLNFGRTSATYSLGEHTLGPLRCSASFQSSSSMPSSCADLWRRGETVNGFYQVRTSSGKMLTVFCDMSKLPDEPGQQTLIGTSDVKSEIVYFTVMRETPYSTVGVIPYEKALLNIGNAMNLQTGQFTAPKRGIYFFSFTLSSVAFSWAEIRHNDNGAGVTLAVNNNGLTGASAQATIQLNAGDIVDTNLKGGDAWSNFEHPIHFTGYLLEEL